MAARNYITSGTYTFSGKSYWLLSSQSHAGLTATANGATSAANFNHANTATAQRWLLLTADEAAASGLYQTTATGARQYFQAGDVRFVEFCWYDGCEAPDYYEGGR